VVASATLLVSSPDQRGIVASLAEFIYKYNGNVLHADQHRDNNEGLFFTRIEWSLDGFALGRSDFWDRFEPLSARFCMSPKLYYSTDRQRVGLFVSRYQHCLVDLLQRHQIGELPCDISFIVSNLPDAADIARFFGVPFHYVPVTSESKDRAEADQLRLVAEANPDLLVLARYMQVLSPEFVANLPGRIINVHHSFLPAFTGARPYHAAYHRGVKLIGATSHYVTEALDEGPIIEQDVTRISHRDQVEDLIQKGRDLEKVVLSRAVRWHLQHRILTYGNKTVVFD
jgi:formyltetrahydrofolate deformylase